MADDKSKHGQQDRIRVARNEPYEVDYLASKHGLTREQAQFLIKQHGNDRAKIDAAAKKLKSH
jgi:hypothetical protein